MNFKKHHTGIISRNITKDSAAYEKLGYFQRGEIYFDEVQSNRLLFLLNAENDCIELIEAVGQCSTVKNAKGGLHHICYEVQSIHEAKAYFCENRLGTVFAEFVAPALGNRPIAFICLRSGAIIELLESGELNENIE